MRVARCSHCKREMMVDELGYVPFHDFSKTTMTVTTTVCPGSNKKAVPSPIEMTRAKTALKRIIRDLA